MKNKVGLITLFAPFGSSGPFGFGAPAATTPNFSLGGGTTTTTSTGLGFGGLSSAGTGFGALGGFGSGAAASSAPAPAFGFGSTLGAQTSAGSSLFSGFGQPAATSAGFGAKPATGSLFGGFGTGLGGSAFGQPQPQPQQPQINPEEALYNAVTNCNIYGDERDSTLVQWNQLQAFWGVGKGYYSTTAPPVEFTQQNPFCRFKAIGYNCMPTTENKDGLVALVFNQKATEIKNNEASLINTLNIVLGNRPNLTVVINSVLSTSETKTQVTIYVQEKLQTGGTRRVLASELAAHLQKVATQQPTSLSAESVLAVVRPDKDQLTEYLEQPPAGVDARQWKQAQLNNPNPARYIPVPMVGFAEVCWRLKSQEQETKRHRAFLDKVAEEIASLQRCHNATVVKLAENRRKFVELEHRVLQVVVKQEISRKMGFSLTPEEEALRSKLESIQARLNTPTQLKGQLNEILAQMRMQKQDLAHRDLERYTLDEGVRDDIKQLLKLQQNGMAHLMQTVHADLSSLKLIKDGMLQVLHGQ
ncbi:probable nucleoporin Nup54 isoform X2 [Bacillus rossius redtenbacheri]|uniref:probable nucleoporin Nup54 isoform X2 n=1 Tax=Bacillus rossius redtenbacheri TaxID=93214 RepID=UPI002FDF001D